MKTAPFLALLVVGLASSISAQNVVVMGALTPSAAPAAPAVCSDGTCRPRVAYRAPVAYPAPVSYAAPAPVYYSPNVIYIGGACGYPRPNYFSGYGCGYGYRSYSPSVIYFGGGQAYVHGYNFTHCR
jgi:hypothetical protein